MIVLQAVTVLSAVAVEPSGQGRKKPPTIAKAQALREKGPNVVLVILDGLSSSVTGEFHQLSTAAPHLDRLLRLGMRFNKMHAPTVGDNAARISLLTGMTPWESGVVDDAQDWRRAAALQDKPTLPELFRQCGFITAGAGRIFHAGYEQAQAWDERFNGGNAASPNEQTLEWAGKFLKKRRETPFLLVVGLEGPAHMQSGNDPQILNAYDQAAQSLLQSLEQDDLIKKTVLMVVGTPQANATTSSVSRTHVPLSIYVPEATAPDTVYDSPASWIDVFPTLCETVGDVAMPEHLSGRSLVKLWQQPAAETKTAAVTVEGTGAQAAFTVLEDRWRYYRGTDGRELLHDMDRDPTLMNNLASLPEHAQIKQQLASRCPQKWVSFSRSLDEVAYDAAADGSVTYWLQAGDDFEAGAAPDLRGRGLDMELVFDYKTKADANGTLLCAGDEKLGFALHLKDGKPCFTVTYEGLCTTLKADKTLDDGEVALRALLGLDGSLHIAAAGGNAHGYAPMEGGFSRPLAGRFRVGQQGQVLPHKRFPEQAGWSGRITRASLSLLPGVTAESRAAKAVPVE